MSTAQFVLPTIQNCKRTQ